MHFLNLNFHTHNFLLPEGELLFSLSAAYTPAHTFVLLVCFPTFWALLLFIPSLLTVTVWSCWPPRYSFYWGAALTPRGTVTQPLKLTPQQSTQLSILHWHCLALPTRLWLLLGAKWRVDGRVVKGYLIPERVSSHCIFLTPLLCLILVRHK